jgi:hypothetical protein
MLQQDIDNLVDVICDKYYAGGPLHLVLDDFNVDTDSIKWCMENTIPKEENIAVKLCSEKLCELLLSLSLEQRIEYLHIDADYELLNYLKGSEFGLIKKESK